jgi:hypothetical protein
MKMKRLNKQPLGQTLLQAQEDKPRRTPRSYYSDQNARTKNEKNDKKQVFQKFNNDTTSYHSASTQQT